MSSKLILPSNYSDGVQPAGGVVIYRRGDPINHTGVTTADVTLETLEVPPLGVDGVIRVHFKASWTDGVTTSKNIKVRLAGQNCYSITSTVATVESFTGMILIQNRNSKTSQIAGPPFIGGFGTNNDPYTLVSADTSVETPLTFHATLGDAANFLRLESYFVEIFP